MKRMAKGMPVTNLLGLSSLFSTSSLLEITFVVFQLFQINFELGITRAVLATYFSLVFDLAGLTCHTFHMFGGVTKCLGHLTTSEMTDGNTLAIAMRVVMIVKNMSFMGLLRTLQFVFSSGQ